MANAEGKCSWHFAVKNGGVHQGPNEAMGDTFKKLPYESLVRESLQNSLDAAAGDEPVVVNFRHRRVDSRNYPKMFELREHIEACLKMYPNDDARKRFFPMLEYINTALEENALYYLEVSDENTKGMPYTKGDTNSPFYAFVKSIGNSVKSNESKGGSHGFGKAAYFNASHLRTVMISTMTESGQCAFEGVSGLCTHEFEGKTREHYGFYTDGQHEDPICDSSQIPARFRRQLPGTSAFIMGVDFDEKGKRDMVEKILQSVIMNFWMAILANKLRVSIQVETKVLECNADNILQILPQVFKNADDTKTGHSTPRPYIDAFVNVGKDFNHYKFEKEMPTLGKLEFYLRKIKTGTDTILCMRSPMMLVRHIKNRTNYGFYGIFLCRDSRKGKGNDVLRAMENARHDQWDYRNCSDRSDRDKAKSAEKEMQAFIDECIEKAFNTDKKDYLTFGGLEDFLSIPSSLTEDDFEGGMESEIGKTDGSRTENENGSPTSDITEDYETSEVNTENVGTVVIKEPANSTVAVDGGTGDQGEGGEGGADSATEGFSGSDGKRDNNQEGDGAGGGSHGETGTNPGTGGAGAGFEAGAGSNTRHTRLRVTYRAFAQHAAGGGYTHRLVINSNRASDNATIIVKCVGEVSEEALPLFFSDCGVICDNMISKVELKPGRNILNISFDDDMRHSIKLEVNED